jgi:hypothetical protein
MSEKSDLITAKLNLKYLHNTKASLDMNDNDLKKIAEYTAEMISKNMRNDTPPHPICPFTKETVSSLQDLAYYFSTAQKAFKGFIVLCIVMGAIAVFLIGLRSKGMEFWNYIKGM